MKGLISSPRVAIPVLLSLFLLGCFATQAQWMAYVMVDPDALNEVLVDAEGNVVHVSEQADGVHLATYDQDGNILFETVADVALPEIQQAVDLPNQQLLLIGATLADSWLVDTNLHQVTPFDVTALASGMGDRTIGGVSNVWNDQLALFGSVEDQGWALLIDFAGASSQLLDVATTQGVNAVFGYDGLVVEVVTDLGREVVSYDASLVEIGRFTASSNDTLIGDSNGRPTLFNTSNHNVKVTDVTGAVQWTFVNAELEQVDGKSVGPDGSVVLWGDNARFNLLLGVVLDNAHLLRIDADGELQYHYLGGDSMVNIAYSNVKQFENGSVQMSFQGWTGEVSGLLFGSELGTPFTVTKRVYHDFISALGNKSRWMLEPKRVETYSQCGSLCIGLLNSTEGHCSNLDVFNIDSQSLISVSQVCGVEDEDGVLQPDVVKVSLY